MRTTSWSFSQAKRQMTQKLRIQTCTIAYQKSKDRISPKNKLRYRSSRLSSTLKRAQSQPIPSREPMMALRGQALPDLEWNPVDHTSRTTSGRGLLRFQRKQRKARKKSWLPTSIWRRCKTTWRVSWSKSSRKRRSRPRMRSWRSKLFSSTSLIQKSNLKSFKLCR